MYGPPCHTTTVLIVAEKERQWSKKGAEVAKTGRNAVKTIAWSMIRRQQALAGTPKLDCWRRAPASCWNVFVSRERGGRPIALAQIAGV